MTTIAATTHLRPFAPAQPTPVAPPIDPYDPAVIAGRIAAGKRAESTADKLPDGFVGRPAPTYFRTYDQLKTAMFELQAKYPNLVEVRDIGDSAEKIAGTADRDILALVITNKATGAAGSKPASMHTAGIHAREIANPELLMTFATNLLEGHGSDAESTMLVDHRETILVPMLNPDGHAVVERGFANERGGNTMQRKSTSGGDPSRGTDLNRNFDYHWGGPGASSNPSSETYRGPSAGSEPETKSIQTFLGERKPQMYIDWHSYSELNMFPWGDTKAKTKDHAAFQAIAQKMTTFNGYSPIQSIELYPTTGTTDDYAYGAHGVPGMVIETGTSFHQSDNEFRTTLAKNLPVLDYMVKTADAPFERVFGPDTSEFSVDAASGAISARVSDANNGKERLKGAELVVDPTAAPGTGVALTAADGAFDSVNEVVAGTVTGAAQAAAGQLVYVRGVDASGHWGPLTPQWLNGAAK